MLHFLVLDVSLPYSRKSRPRCEIDNDGTSLALLLRTHTIQVLHNNIKGELREAETLLEMTEHGGEPIHNQSFPKLLLLQLRPSIIHFDLRLLHSLSLIITPRRFLHRMIDSD